MLNNTHKKIEISELKESDIGRLMIYESLGVKEEGKLSSWNSKYVLIKFNGVSKSCSPDDVYFSRL